MSLTKEREREIRLKIGSAQELISDLMNGRRLFSPLEHCTRLTAALNTLDVLLEIIEEYEERIIMDAVMSHGKD